MVAFIQSIQTVPQAIVAAAVVLAVAYCFGQFFRSH